MAAAGAKRTSFSSAAATRRSTFSTASPSARCRASSLTLIARDVLTPYSGMLPGFIAGHYTVEQCYIDLAPLAARAGARLVHDEAIGLDRAARAVLCRDGPPIPYDIVSHRHRIDPEPEISCRRRALRHAGQAGVDVARALGRAFGARRAQEHGPLRFVTVGGGAAGVEVTLAMRHRLRTLAVERGRDPDALQLHRRHQGRAAGGPQRVGAPPLPPRPQGAGRDLRRARSASAPSRRAASSAPAGAAFAYDELIWVTEAGGAPWLAETGLALDRAGFIVVDATLRSVTDPRIFAAGDVGSNRDHPRPKAGVFAVRQGPPLAENLHRVLAGAAPLPFTPQREFLSLISTGDKYAIASRGRWAAEGRLVWWLKDQIDRRWMRQWQEPARLISR